VSLRGEFRPLSRASIHGTSPRSHGSPLPLPCVAVWQCSGGFLSRLSGPSGSSQSQPRQLLVARSAERGPDHRQAGEQTSRQRTEAAEAQSSTTTTTRAPSAPPGQAPSRQSAGRVQARVRSQVHHGDGAMAGLLHVRRRPFAAALQRCRAGPFLLASTRNTALPLTVVSLAQSSPRFPSLRQHFSTQLSHAQIHPRSVQAFAPRPQRRPGQLISPLVLAVARTGAQPSQGKLLPASRPQPCDRRPTTTASPCIPARHPYRASPRPSQTLPD
jgi:hypothetical protein